MMTFGSPIEEMMCGALWWEGLQTVPLVMIRHDGGQVALAANTGDMPQQPEILFIDPQTAVGKYTADFVLQIHESRVAVECDGHDYHERTKEQAEHDRKRDRFFMAEGVAAVRFTGREIARDARKCAREAIGILMQVYAKDRAPLDAALRVADVAAEKIDRLRGVK